MMRIAVTGGPGSGKSTLLQELAALGHLVVPETYRWLRVLQAIESNREVSHQRLSDADFLLHLALQAFCEDINVPKSPYCFFDRTLIDVLAYCQAYEQESRVDLAWRLARRTASHITAAVFLPVPQAVEGDALRLEDISEAQRLHEVILGAYRACQVPVILLPSGGDARSRAALTLHDLAIQNWASPVEPESSPPDSL